MDTTETSKPNLKNIIFEYNEWKNNVNKVKSSDFNTLVCKFENHQTFKFLAELTG